MDIKFNYKLNPKSVVFDIGGYKGDFAEWIRKTYGCGVHIFEPLKKHFSFILERFKHDPMYWPYHVALEDQDTYGEIFESNDSSSIYSSSKDKPKEIIKIRDINKFIRAFRFNIIDLIKMNCEGSEYKIIDRLKSTNWINNVNNYVIQFHNIKDKNIDDYLKIFEENYEIKHKCSHWVWLEKK